MKFIPPVPNVFLLDFKALSLASPEPETLGAMKKDSLPPAVPEPKIGVPSEAKFNLGFVLVLIAVLPADLFRPAPIGITLSLPNVGVAR